MPETPAVKQKEEVKKRPPCPFYGFMGLGNVFMDNNGNACGLTGSHTPCSMEMGGQNPSWHACTVFNHRKNEVAIGELIQSGVIFPDELRPVGQREWSGIPLKDWFEKIMERK